MRTQSVRLGMRYYAQCTHTVMIRMYAWLRRCVRSACRQCANTKGERLVKCNGIYWSMSTLSGKIGRFHLACRMVALWSCESRVLLQYWQDGPWALLYTLKSSLKLCFLEIDFGDVLTHWAEAALLRGCHTAHQMHRLEGSLREKGKVTITQEDFIMLTFKP